jgi:hypothetical protein
MSEHESEENNSESQEKKEAKVKQGEEFRIRLEMESEDQKKRAFLAQYAEAKLLERAQNLGIDPKGKEPSELVQAVRDAEKEIAEKVQAPSGENTENFYSVGQQTGKPQKVDLKKYEDLPLDLCEFDSQEEMLQFLKTVAGSESDLRRHEAQRRLKQLNARVLGQNAEYELQGKISEFLRNKKAPKPEMKKIEKEQGD